MGLRRSVLQVFITLLPFAALCGISTPGVYTPPDGFFGQRSTLIDFDTFPSGETIPSGYALRADYALWGITFDVEGGPSSRYLNVVGQGTAGIDYISPLNDLFAGHTSYNADNGSVTVVMSFDPAMFSHLPTAVGFIFTDSAPNNPFTATAYDTDNVPVDSVTINTADNNWYSDDHAEDTFIGLTNLGGIVRVEYTTEFMLGNSIYGFEIDNVQFSPSVRARPSLVQITDRGGGSGGPCSGCCQIVHRQPIMAPQGGQFVFASTWNRDALASNPNTNRNTEVFRYDLASGLFLEDTITDVGISVPFDFIDTSIAFVSSSPELPSNTDTNAEVFVYDPVSPTNIQAVTVTSGFPINQPPPPLGGTEPVIQWATEVLAFSSQYSASSWSANQALGEPDTYPNAGDSVNAWCSATANGQREFLELAFSNALAINEVDVYETYYPGAVDRVLVRSAEDGTWEEVWSGQAAATIESARVFRVRFPLTPFLVDAVRLELDSPAVPGWQEIDAVSAVYAVDWCPTAWFSETNWWTVANTHADISTDGRFVVWAGNRNIPSVSAPAGTNADENYEIWLKDLTSGAIRQLTQSTGGDLDFPPQGANLWPRVSTGGGRVVFVSNRDLDGTSGADDSHNLFVWTASGGISRLTPAELSVEREFPAFGMDDKGSRVVFASDADLTGENSDGNMEIFTVALPSGLITQITDTSGEIINSRPILSGNGLKVAFLSNADLSGFDQNDDGSVELCVFHFDEDRAYVDPFVQVTDLPETPVPTKDRTHWMDWYSMDRDGSHLVMCTNADLIGQNTEHAYEIFLAAFDWEPIELTIATINITPEGYVELEWEGGQPDLQFTVESSQDCGSDSWLPVAPAEQWPIESTTWTSSLPILDNHEYFRVRGE